jgi:hypothetical protein
MDLEELRDSARSKADEQATGFITDTELNRFLNQGNRLVYGKIVQTFEEFFVVKGTTGNGGAVAVAADQNEISLPATLLKLVRVERRNTNDSNENNWRKLPRLNIGNDQLNDFYPIREGRDQGFGYYLAGEKMYLRPVPQGGFDLRMWFVPKCTAMSANSDEPDVPEEYHELVAEYGAIQCLAKSGEGIWKERMDTFNLELANMLETVTHRVQEPQQMIITDDYDFDRWSQ